MKKLIFIIYLLSSTTADCQYFRRWFGNSATATNYKQHAFYDGLCSKLNYTNGSELNFVNAATGVAIATAVSSNNANELRLVRTHRNGTSVLTNKGLRFKDASNTTSNYYHAIGRSICEVEKATGDGGYVVVGSVSTNNASGATVPGGSDALITKFSSNGNINMQKRVNFRSSGYDELFSVTRSEIHPDTFYACGSSIYSSNKNLLVMCFNKSGNIAWGFTYRLNITGINTTTFATGYSIIEDSQSGNLIVVGTIQDPEGSSGIDALVVVLNSSGIVQTATAYHYGTIDEYRAITRAEGGSYALCGFTNYNINGGYGLLVAKAGATGVVSTHKMTNVVIVGEPNPTQLYGYDIVSRTSSVTGQTHYYVAFSGNGSAPGAVASGILKTEISCEPSEMYRYDDLTYNDAVALDYSDTVEQSAGLRLFTNIREAVAPNRTEAYMLKAYMNGATCTDYCPEDSFTLQTPLYTTYNVSTTPYSNKTTVGLQSAATSYSTQSICSQSPIACGDNSRYGVSEDETVEYEPNDISIFPNPAVDELTIKFNQEIIDGKIEIMNHLGQVVLQKSIIRDNDTYSDKINLMNLKPGLYILQFTSERQKTYTGKFIRR